eukprot:5985779-Pleurochrysis_carterae.AAC.1
MSTVNDVSETAGWKIPENDEEQESALAAIFTTLYERALLKATWRKGRIVAWDKLLCLQADALQLIAL